MEGGRHDLALANQDREAIALGQHFNGRTGLGNAWGADEDHLQRAAGKLGFGSQNGRVDLAPVSVALHDGIEQTFDVLPEIISTLRARGYTFVTVDEMMKDQYIAQAKLVAKPMIRHTAPWPK